MDVFVKPQGIETYVFFEGLDINMPLAKARNIICQHPDFQGLAVSKLVLRLVVSTEGKKPTKQQEDNGLALDDETQALSDAFADRLATGRVFLLAHCPPIAGPALDTFHNVLTARPRTEADACAHLIRVADPAAAPTLTGAPPAAPVVDGVAAALAARHRQWSEQLRVVSDAAADVLAKDTNPSELLRSMSLPLLDTESHRLLLQYLVAHAEQLAAGAFRYRTGTSCHTLVGMRGIGKTNVMCAFAATCPAFFPSVIPLYITGAGISDDTSSFRHQSLRQLMISAARAHGLEVDESKGADALLVALRSAGKQMLLMVDEAEELFSVDEQQPRRENVRRTLGTLQWLGDQQSGLFSVLLCGSSASLYRLISKQHDYLRDDFPLIKDGVPDLNSTKYTRLVVPSPPCNDSEHVLCVMRQLKLWEGLDDEEQRAKARILTFFAGTTPRALCQAFAPFPSGEFTQERLQALVSPRLQVERVGKLKEDARLLFTEVLRQLLDANEQLVNRLRDGDGGCKLEALVAVKEQPKGVQEMEGMERDTEAPRDWEELLTPVGLSAVTERWIQVATFKGLSNAGDSSFAQALLEGLADAGLVAIRTEPGMPTRVWPISVAQLVFANQESVGGRLLQDAVRYLRPT